MASLQWGGTTTEEITAQAIRTPYAVEVQGSSKSALEALSNAQNGATLYRTGTLGQNMTAESQYWSLQNPITDSSYASQMGIPATGPGDQFVITGTLNPGASVITNTAPGLGANAGGGIQVVVSPGGVRLSSFTVQ